MAQTTYQVILSTDGKHTVIVTSDNQAEVKTAVGWCKATYDRLVELYGLKYEQYQRNGESNGKEEETPTCAVHQLPMVKVVGKRGEFWSCHQRNQDGTFCKYRPPKV